MLPTAYNLHDKLRRLYTHTRVLESQVTSSQDLINIQKSLVQTILQILDPNTLQQILTAETEISQLFNRFRQLYRRVIEIEDAYQNLKRKHKQITSRYMLNLDQKNKMIKDFRDLIALQQRNIELLNQQRRGRSLVIFRQAESVIDLQHADEIRKLMEDYQNQIQNMAMSHQFQNNQKEKLAQNAEKKIKIITASIKIHRRKNKDLKHELEKKDKKIDLLEEKQQEIIDQKNKQSQEYQAEINKLQNTISNLIQNQFTNRMTFESTCGELQGKVIELTRNINIKQKRITSLQEQLRLQIKKSMDKDEEMKDQRTQIITLQAEKYFNQQRFNNMKSVQTQVQRDIQQAQTKVHQRDF